jgi:remodeling and spacing factor 1
MVQTPSIESRYTNASSLLSATAKTLKADALPENTCRREAGNEVSATLTSEDKPTLMTHDALAITGAARAEESVPLKSIETPVITSSPLKLVNIAELKQPEEKSVSVVTPIIDMPLNAAKKHGSTSDETADPIAKNSLLDKLSGKNNLSFSSVENSIPMGHNKLSIKPIDQLAANLVRIQSEKLEKPTSGPKSLEKIAESLARSSGMLGSMVNGGEDDRLPQDFCSRNQSEKSATLRGHRGIDLSTSPRGWESANEQNRPMDFSGIDLSSRKLGKAMDLPSPGYRTQPDFQHREMDLSTKKLSKPEVPNLPYDTRSVMMRNHAMVADLSKRQMPFTAYEMSSTPYHNAARLPAKDEHRLPSYTVLPDPSKITALRMNAASLKRPLEGDDVQQDMLKRIRADVIPIRGSMDKRPMMGGGNWREEVGEAIEEPMMMVQGEGSGSDCDAVNPGVSEAIEEPTIFFYGEGSGIECETGNPGDDTSTDNKESNESKTEPDSATATLSQNKVLTEDETVSAGSLLSNKTPVKLNRNYPPSNVSINDNCQIVDSIQEKPKFKPTLGVQIISKSTTGPVKKLSRWDVGKPEGKVDCDNSIISNEEDISFKRTTDDDGHDKVKQASLVTIDGVTTKTGYEESVGVNQDVKVDESSVNEESANPEASDVPSSEHTSTMEEERHSKGIREPMQCDSSSQADTSQIPELCTTNPESTIHRADVQSAKSDNKSDSTVSRESNVSEAVDNECKPVAASPPRFFFGPNCIAYTSKCDESEIQSEHDLATSTQDKTTDTVQYECVSSSKSADEVTVHSYQGDFDLTQTNNNSLKTSPFAPESPDNPEILHKNEKEDAERIEESNKDAQWNERTPTFDSSSTAEDHTANSSVAQINTREIVPITQESVITEKKMKENNVASMLDTSPASETAIENESVTEEGAIKISSINDQIKLEESERIVEPSRYDRFADPGKPVNTTSQESISVEKTNVTHVHVLDDEKNENELSLANDDKNDDCQMASDLGVFEDDQRIKESVTVHLSSSLVQNVQAELDTDLRELEDRIDDPTQTINKLSDSTNATECADYHREANTPPKNDLDPAAEGCDKQSDKNDNFSEIDGQEDHSTDTDNERMKGLAGSDADSVCVNYDRNSERTDALSDMGMQDDGSGDSGEEIKEKGLNEARVNDTVFGMDSATRLAENAMVTSSGAPPQDSDNLVPGNTSENTRVQDSSSLEDDEPRGQANDEKTENRSSNVNDLSTSADIPSAVVPAEINTFQLSESQIVEATREANLPNLVQSTSEYADDVSENPSSCVDSNEEMVIDDRVSESNDSSKETEEATCTLAERQSEDTDKNADEPATRFTEEKAPAVSTVIEQGSSGQTVMETEILEKKGSGIDAANESNGNNLTQEHTEIDEEKETCRNDKRDAVIAKDTISGGIGIDENLGKSERDSIDATIEKSGTDCVTSATCQELQGEATNDDKPSIVTNYNSESSDDDGSDDVFEPDAPQVSDSEVDDTSIIQIKDEMNNKMHENSAIREDETNDTVSICDMPREQPSTEQRQIDEYPEMKIKEMPNEGSTIVEQEMKVSTQQRIDENMQIKPVCNNIEYPADDEPPTMPLNILQEDNKDKLQEETNLRNVFTNDQSDVSDATKLLADPIAEDVREFALSSKNAGIRIMDDSAKDREYPNNLIDNVKVEQKETGAEKARVKMEKTDCFASENIDCLNEDDAGNREKSSFARDDMEFNALSGRVTETDTFYAGERHTRNVDEKLSVSLEAEDTAARLKDSSNECAFEELPTPCKRFKEDLAEYADDKNTKWNVKSQLREESLTKLPWKEEFMGVNLAIHQAVCPPESNILPSKLENASTDVSKTYTCKIESASLESVDSDTLYSNSMYTKMENVNNLDSSSNNQKQSLNVTHASVDKITENSSKSSPSSPNDDVGSVVFQHTISEIGTIKSDLKKEASKRLIDISDVEDVPPLKSKPPYMDTSETLEDMTSTDIQQAPKSLDTFREIEKFKSQIKDETKAAAICTTQLFQNDFDMVNDIASISAAISRTEDSRKKESLEIQSIEMKTEIVASDDSIGADNESVNVPAEDPLACTNDDPLKIADIVEDDISDDTSKISIRIKSVSETVYEGWKLDSTMEPPKISRKRRNSAHESNSEDGAVKPEDEEMMGGKRMKLRAKRMPDKELRKSIEESRDVAVSSEDEVAKCRASDNVVEHANKDGSDDLNIMQSMVIDRKIRGRPRGRRRRGFRGGGRPSRPKLTDLQVDQISPGVHPDGTPNDAAGCVATPMMQKRRKKRESTRV